MGVFIREKRNEKVRRRKEGKDDPYEQRSFPNESKRKVEKLTRDEDRTRCEW